MSTKRAKSVLMGFRNGLMKLNMRVNGIIIRLMARVNFGVQTGIHMKEIGEMIKQMDLGTLSLKTERNDT